MNLRVGLYLTFLLVLASSSASAADFTGFWKEFCTDAFGIQIKPHSAKTYSVSFCGPGGCFEPGTWRPDSIIEGDPDYRVIDAKNIELKQGGRWQRYTKCASDTSPVLDYSTMKDVSRDSRITYFEPNKGLPNYEKKPPFSVRDPRLLENLKRRLANAPVATAECENGKAKVPEFGDRSLFSNLCTKPVFDELKNLVSRLAPTLDKNRLTMWKTALHSPENEGLLVGYIDISDDKNFKYPYLSLWYLDFTNGTFTATYGGSYLAGQIHAIRQFGTGVPRKQVFVKFQSCIECEPWVLMTAVDFTPSGNAFPYQFTYAADHMEFASSFEYELPGMGHSVEADVETRVPKANAAQSPHLFQHFKYRDEDKQEWWVFTCKARKCDYEMYLNSLPSKYQQAWNSAEKL